MSQTSLLFYLSVGLLIKLFFSLALHGVCSKGGVTHSLSGDILKVVDIYRVWVNYGFALMVYQQ